MNGVTIASFAIITGTGIIDIKISSLWCGVTIASGQLSYQLGLARLG
jgi:hypothetical protein